MMVRMFLLSLQLSFAPFGCSHACSLESRMGLPARESTDASSGEISLQVGRGTEQLRLFLIGNLSGNRDLDDCDGSGMATSISCLIASVKSGTESSFPLRRRAW